MKKLCLAALTCLLVLVMNTPVQGQPASVVNTAPNIFTDILPTYWAVAWINELYHEGITGGCAQSPLRFCPEDNVTRAQMAVFLLKAIHSSIYLPPSSGDIFSDIPANYWAKDWINQLYTESVTGGCTQSPLSFCPEDNVTRAEMAVFLLKAIHGSSYHPPASGNIFSDVPSTYWAKDWINQLYAEGVTGGCSRSPLDFCPEDNVTRAQMAVFLLKSIHGSTYQPPTIDPGPMIGNCPLYPANNIWNTPVNTLPVHILSDSWVNSIGRNTGFHMDFGSGTWGGGPIGIPYNLVNGSQVTKYNVSFYYPDESDPGPYPLPASPLIEYGSDHHILTVDQETCNLYEIYDASFSGGGWSGGSGAIWDLNSNALRPDGWTSADAAGLPMLPGLVRYDEIAAGVISHALRFTASSTNSYIWPARHLTSGSPGVLTTTPPMGAHFRLKASYDISTFPPELQIILQAMKTYGIILADNGSNWYVSGAPDERWNNDMLHQLDVLTGNDFEVVDTSVLMVDPNSGEAKLPTSSSYWKPSIGDTLQIQYTGVLNTSVNANIYDLDLFGANPGDIATLKSQGRKLMCYLDAGSWEDWRPDAGQFPAVVLGKEYVGWPGERWLDIRRIDLLAPILRARLDLCKSKGFDGVDADNVIGYFNDTGFPLSAQDQLIFNAWLADEAHARGLSIGLKNDSDQISQLLPYFDWGLSEECYLWGSCAAMSPFIQAGKPVFAVEYTDTSISFSQFCAQAAALHMTGILKNHDLDAYVQACP